MVMMTTMAAVVAVTMAAAKAAMTTTNKIPTIKQTKFERNYGNHINYLQLCKVLINAGPSKTKPTTSTTTTTMAMTKINNKTAAEGNGIKYYMLTHHPPLYRHKVRRKQTVA